MVLITPAEEEQLDQRVVIACGESPPDMDTTTHIPSPSLRPSPSLERLKKEGEEEEGAYSDLNTSSLLNGKTQDDCSVPPSTDALGESSPGLSPRHKAAVKTEEEEEEEESQSLVVDIEQELDAPLDFSIKRKDSGPDHLRKGPTPPFKSWHCPRPFLSSPSLRLSPDTSPQQPGGPGSRHHNDSGEGWGGGGGDFSRSPSPSHPHSAASTGRVRAALSPGPGARSSGVGGPSEESGGDGPAAMLAQKTSLVQGSLTSFPALLEEARKLQASSGGKVQRPFKAYPKEILRMPLGYLGLPGVSPFSGMDGDLVPALGVLQEDLMTAYHQQVEALKEQERLVKTAGKRSSRSPLLAPSPSSSSLSPASSNGRGQSTLTTTPPPPTSAGHFLSSAPSMHSDSPSPGPSAGSRASPSPPAQAHTPSSAAVSQGSDSSLGSQPSSAAAPLVSSTSSVTTSAASGSRKRPRNMPDTQKDDAYWERRRKNNDAAKRSRDARRAKEDEIALRAALLEQENLRLRVEVATLKTEMARLRCLLYKA